MVGRRRVGKVSLRSRTGGAHLFEYCAVRALLTDRQHWPAGLTNALARCVLATGELYFSYGIFGYFNIRSEVLRVLHDAGNQ